LLGKFNYEVEDRYDPGDTETIRSNIQVGAFVYFGDQICFINLLYRFVA